MSEKIKRNFIQCLSIVTILNVLVGCSFINVYSEIKKDPIVMDVEIYQIEEEVICKVILEPDAYIDDTYIKANQYRKTIQNEFDNSNIIIKFIQNGVEIGTY